MGNRVQRPVEQGFTYLLLLIVIATISAVAALSLQEGRALAQRYKETELLHVGAEFRRALVSYEVATPPGGSRAPRTLSQLVRDDRGPIVRRHLRRVVPDPLSGSTEWGFIRDITGGIIGVYSLAPGAPVKQDGFDPPFESFRDSKSYAAWTFSPHPIRAGN